MYNKLWKGNKIMEEICNRYPQTIGEELKYQIEYKKLQDRKFNYDKLSRLIRDNLKKEFGFERKDDDENISTRAAMINELLGVGTTERTPKYIYLYTAFKSLKVINDEIIILQIFNDYNIIPKKNVDKKLLQDIEKNFISFKIPATNLVYYAGIHICTKYNRNKAICLKCKFKTKCIYLKILHKIESYSVEEQIKFLYSIGLPTSITKSLTKYTITIDTLKKILETLNLLELKKSIEDIENKFKQKELKEIEIRNKSIEYLKRKLEIEKTNLKYLKSQVNHKEKEKNQFDKEIEYNIEKVTERLTYYKESYEKKKKNNISNKIDSKYYSLKKQIDLLLY